MTSTQSARDTQLAGIIEATGQATAQDPSRGHALFRAVGSGTEGVRTELRAGHHDLVVDEPPQLGGEDAGPNPVEVALAGLLSCQVVTYRFWAAKLGIPLDDVRVDVEGDLDVRGFFGLEDGVRAGLTEVRMVVDLKGPASAEDYQRLKDAVDDHCPVVDMFRNPTPVRVTLAE